MKHLPWALLALVLAYSVVFGQGTLTKLGTLKGPVKILGQPAASEWLDIESNQLNGSPTQYIVPPGKALYLSSILRRQDTWTGVLVHGNLSSTVCASRRRPWHHLEGRRQTSPDRPSSERKQACTRQAQRKVAVHHEQAGHKSQ